MALNVSNMEIAQNFKPGKAPEIYINPVFAYGGRILSLASMAMYAVMATRAANEKFRISEKQAATAEFIIKRIVLEDIDFNAWLDDKLQQKGLTHDTTIERTDA
jgi:hypothetical protein